jgi:hypothetical protein
MGDFFTWQAIVMFLLGVALSATVKGFANKAKAKTGV